jgi:protein-disulfide isomerase
MVVIVHHSGRRRQVTRFSALIAALAVLALAGGVPAEPLPAEQALKERIMGDPEAPITIIEYASLTCPACARFHADTLPQIKTEWIETGRAKLVYRDYPLDKYAASAAMIARCAPENRYFTFLSAFFSQQKNWARAADPVSVLTQLAGLGGMSKDDVDACLANDALQDGILQMRLDGQMEFDIKSTPSFVVNGRVIHGGMSYADFKDILEDAAK